MTEIKRFVSYIYMYDNGIKGNNVGFAKVDSRNGQCKIAVNIKGLESSNGKCEKVYLFYRRQEKILGIYIGSFQIVNGIGEFHEQLHTQNIKDSNLSLDEMNGILVREEDRNMRVFASGWDDYAIVVDQFCVHNGETISSDSDGKDKVLLYASEVEEKRKEPIIFFDRTWKEKDDAADLSTEQIAKEVTEEGKTQVHGMEDKGGTESATEGEKETEDKYGRGVEKQKADYERGVKRGQKMDIMQKDGGEHNASDLQKGGREDALQEMETKEEGDYLQGTVENISSSQESLEVHKGQNSEFMQQAEGVETVTIEGADGEKSRKNTHNSDSKAGMDWQQSVRGEAISENGVLWGTYTPSIWKEISWEEYQVKEQQLREQARRCVQQNRVGRRDCLPQEMSSNRMQQRETLVGQVQINKMQQGQVQISGIQQGDSQAAQVQSDLGRQEMVSGNSEKEKCEQKNRLPESITISESAAVSENLQSLEETVWDKLCHQFPKIRAFVDEPESICLKIDLRDLRILPRENWGLGNNSFLLHGYYNFRYLILTQEKGEFVLGIPGIYHPNEKVMASMFGFGGFKPVKVCDKMLGQFGYWYKPVVL